MSSSKKNLSEFDSESIPSAENMTFGIVVSEWNGEITEELYQGAEDVLLLCDCKPENILRHNVPGSFELPAGALFFAEYENVDAVICIGCVIQGETRHFEFICSAVSQGILNLAFQYKKPFIFGVLTTDTVEQAQERAGGGHGNKGVEAAVAAIKMVALQREMQGKKMHRSKVSHQ
jgi:6,7-dimethyl-8-ribityllumazine synthase